jgi:hypothetical protein
VCTYCTGEGGSRRDGQKPASALKCVRHVAEGVLFLPPRGGGTLSTTAVAAAKVNLNAISAERTIEMTLAYKLVELLNNIIELVLMLVSGNYY